MLEKTIIFNCIEKSENLKNDAHLYLSSIKKTNPEILENMYFFQPTENDISDELKEKIEKTKATFIKDVQVSPHSDNSSNYTNVPITCSYFYHKFKHTDKYMLYTDLDVIYIGKLPKDFFKETDKIVVSIFPIEKIKNINDGSFNMETLYNKIESDLPKKWRLHRFLGYVNTWFIYGRGNNKFWNEYKLLTFKILDIFKKKDIQGIDEVAEEMAATMLYSINPENFLNLTEYNSYTAFRENDLLNFDENKVNKNTILWHYNRVNDMNEGVNEMTCDAKKIIKSIIPISFLLENPPLRKMIQC
jgi:hypothetical protein